MAVVESTPVAERENQVHWFAGRAHEVLDDLTAGGAPSVTGMGATEVAETVSELGALAARVHGLMTLALAHADTIGVAAEHGATNTTAWLAAAARLPRGDARRLVKLARRLHDPAADEPGAASAGALLAGAVDLDQAQVITEAVDRLPKQVGPALRVQAEAHLLGEAARHNARDLRLLGRHLHHVIDPGAADAELAKRLDAEELEAARKTFLKLRDYGDGTCRGSFVIPTLAGAQLAKALDALASPKRPDAIARETVEESRVGEQHGDGAEVGAEGEDGEPWVRPRSTAEILGEAFCQLIDRLPASGLPRAAGSNATVVVTMPLETLLGGLKAACLDTGQQLSGSQARVLACEAGIVPAVLGSTSELLDLGRKVRLHQPSQRLAIQIRDKSCTANDCSVPGAYCHVHHKKPWSQGGHTTVKDGTLLCPRHHRMVHHPGYQTTYLDTGRTQITKISRRRH